MGQGWRSLLLSDAHLLPLTCSGVIGRCDGRKERDIEDSIHATDEDDLEILADIGRHVHEVAPVALGQQQHAHSCTVGGKRLLLHAANR